MINVFLSQTILSLPAWIFWLIVLAASMALELTTVNMTTIWFAVGALVALILSMFSVDLTIQTIVFVTVSLLGIAVFVGLVKPRLSKRTTSDRATNADRIVGNEGVVTSTIDPLKSSGQIMVIGQHWSARSTDQSVIEAGEKVIVRGFESVYAMVERIK